MSIRVALCHNVSLGACRAGMGALRIECVFGYRMLSPVLPFSPGAPLFGSVTISSIKDAIIVEEAAGRGKCGDCA